MSKKNTILQMNTQENNIAPVITALQELCENEYVKTIDLFDRDFKSIIDRLLDDSFRIAVVGEFSSGKSTFLNALLGKDLLKHGATETTATITEIHNCNSDGTGTYLDIHYLTGEVETHIPADRITDYTTTSSTTNAVAQEIEKVVITDKILDTDANVCFVDTPGLNGIADKHREKTIEEIKNAHACIYLLSMRGLGQSDIDFLKYISKYQHNIIFVQNFIDELKKFEGETPEQKVDFQKEIIDKELISENQELRYEIVAVSSRKALMSKSKDFDVYNGEPLTEELRDKIYIESRFDDVFTVINKLMVNNEKGKTQQKDAVAVAHNFLEQLRDLVSFKNDREITAWDASSNGRNAANYSKLIASLTESKQDNVTKLDNYLDSEIADIRKDNQKRLTDGLKQIEEKVTSILCGITDINEFENYVKTQLPNFLYQEITSLDETLSYHMKIRFENMVTNAVLRINQYTGAENTPVKPTTFTPANNEFAPINLETEEDEIKNLQEELAQKKAKYERTGSVKQTMCDEIAEIENRIKELQQTINENKRAQDAAIEKLGQKPNQETKYRNETFYAYRGGLGILDFLLGPKVSTRSVPYLDDSRQQRWLQAKSNIEQTYRLAENQYNAQIQSFVRQKNQLDEEITHLDRTDAAKKQEILVDQRLLDGKINRYNTKKEKAKQEYLRTAKESLRENIHKYLFDFDSDSIQKQLRLLPKLKRSIVN